MRETLNTQIRAEEEQASTESRELKHRCQRLITGQAQDLPYNQASFTSWIFFSDRNFGMQRENLGMLKSFCL